MFVCGHMQRQVHVHSCVPMWQPEGSILCLPQSLPTSFLKTEFLTDYQDQGSSYAEMMNNWAAFYMGSDLNLSNSGNILPTVLSPQQKT